MVQEWGLPPFASECNSRNDRAGALELNGGRRPIAKRRVNPAEARGCLTRRISRLRCQRIGGHGVAHPGPVENVNEVRADIQGRSFPEAETPAKTKILNRPALEPVIVVVSRGCSPLARGGLSPCGGIQQERVVRIKAMAVEVLCEQGHSWNPVREAQRRCVPQQ